MWLLYKTYGLRYFFGADDNFFNSSNAPSNIVETLARAWWKRRPPPPQKPAGIPKSLSTTRSR